MKKAKIFIIFLVVIIAGGGLLYCLKNEPRTAENIGEITSNRLKNMKISSPAFEDGGNVPAHFTCDGEKASPPLVITGVPDGTKSLALILHDPDAPGPDGFTHWVVFNIDPQANNISENTAPGNATEGVNSAGRTGYTPPCPPSRIHHYHFKLYALDNILELNSSAGRDEVEKAMEGHILEQAEMIGLYSRK